MYDHLPPRDKAAITDYDRRVASGELEFDGDFAKDPPESFQWEMDNLKLHLPDMEL
jgi:hypothetical protein